MVVDNTNPDRATRAEWLDLARQMGVKQTRCFVLTTPRELCNHLNLYREYSSNVRRIPDIAFNMFKSRYVEPDVSEGFSHVTHVDFSLQLKSESEKEMFLKWQ